MSFSEYAIWLTVLYIFYYVIVIAIDIYKQNKARREADSEEQVINIAHTVEQYQPVDVSSMLGSKRSEAPEERSFDEEDERAGLDETPEDYNVEEDIEQETAPKDIDVNILGGVSAFDFKKIVSQAAASQQNFFADCLNTPANA